MPAASKAADQDSFPKLIPYSIEWNPESEEYLLIVGNREEGRTKSFKSWGEALVFDISKV
jgi:hypothetical protein